MRSRAAFTTGVLAVALAAVPVAAPAAAAVQDCTKGGGLLSGVTNSLCEVVDAVTDTVDGLTGKAAEPVTKGVDETTGDVMGKVGGAVPSGKHSPTPTPTAGDGQPSPGKSSELLPTTLSEVCLPVLACDDQSVLDRLTPGPAQPATTREPRPSPTPSARPTHRREETQVLPTAAPTPPPPSEPYLIDTPQPVGERRTADTDEPRIDLLWPNPFAEDLAVPLQDRRLVRPSPPASDAVGTALTALLLASAILATRVAHQRRRRAEQHDSIPFEPARVGGRHRLA
ncbi:hypothetical protein [Nonomuraea typhae]|uniref:hypothetical protein n=1 Tax=Nonomuraea typhae TaxID=2603600 RepID=UPI0012F74B78|nr:hypothetical protein [Nonomuraea typhae]